MQSKSLIPKATKAASSALVLKPRGGVLRGLNVVAGASAGFVMLIDAATEPSAGAVTPKRVWPLAANGSMDEKFHEVGLQCRDGVTIVFSTTGPFTYTASATAFIAGEAE